MKPSTNPHHLQLSEIPVSFKGDAAIWREVQLGTMRVGYETYLEDFDDKEILKALPDGLCPCPHWGYVIAGCLTICYPDHEEVVNPGEVYYMAPGHTMRTDAGTVLLEFSPAEEFKKLTELAEQHAHAFQDGTVGDSI